MSRSGLESLSDVREWSGGPPGCPGVVGRPFRMVGRPARMSTSGREAILNGRVDLPDVQEWSGGHSEWSGGPPGCPGVVGRPS